MIDRKLLVMLNMIPMLGPKRINYITDKIKTLPNFLNATYEQILQIPGMNKNIWDKISHYRHKIDVQEEIKKTKKIGAKIITIGDNDYPTILKQIYDPPPVLYVMGNVSTLKHDSLAIVGSRKATTYGKNTARMFGRELAALNFNIVSGMARGIDSFAHWGALEAKGLTTAVLGCGIDIVYPPENLNLMKKIIKYGCVISNFPLGTKPLAKNFPARNRIISGLSKGTIVIEAAERSGSLITADFALEQGREVFAVPGNINNPYSRGSHKLIKQGAKLIEDISDVLEEISFTDINKDVQKSFKPNKVYLKLTKEEKRVFEVICFDPTHFEQIVKKVNMPAKQLNRIITCLEFKELVTTLPGNYIVRI